MAGDLLDVGALGAYLVRCQAGQIIELERRINHHRESLVGAGEAAWA
jgi:hypothetical protein